MRRVLFLAALLGLSAAGSAAAQDQPTVAPGARVRVYVSTQYNSREVASASGYHVGTVGAIDSSAVTLMEEGGSEFRIPFSSIRNLDVSRGTSTAAEGMRTGIRKGALLGAGTTAGAMGLVYGVTKLGDLLHESQCHSEFGDCHNETDPPGKGLLEASWENAGKVAVIGAVGGALLGAAIGSTGREHWQGVRLRTLRLRLQLAPAANGGTAVSLRL
jgi:hypothetical protein